MTSTEQAKAQMVAFLQTKSTKVGVEESKVIEHGIEGLDISYLDGEMLLDILAREGRVETKVHDGEIWVQGQKEA